MRIKSIELSTAASFLYAASNPSEIHMNVHACHCVVLFLQSRNCARPRGKLPQCCTWTDYFIFQLLLIFGYEIFEARVTLFLDFDVFSELPNEWVRPVPEPVRPFFFAEPALLFLSCPSSAVVFSVNWGGHFHWYFVVHLCTSESVDPSSPLNIFFPLVLFDLIQQN